MQSPTDTKYLAVIRSCRNVASAKKFDTSLLNDEIHNVAKIFDNPLPVKILGHVEGLIEFLILNTELQWITWNLDELKSKRLDPFQQLMTACPSRSLLHVLISAVNQLTMGVRQEFCLLLLENFFEDGRFIALLIIESTTCNDSGSYNKAMTDSLLSSLNSLPNKIANNTLGKFSDIFHHEQFFQLLAVQTGEVLECLAGKVRNGETVSTKFIAQMVGLFCFAGKADAFLGVLLPLIIAKSHTDFVWRRITQKMFAMISDRHLEPVAAQVVKTLPWYGCMKWIFEDSILTNKKLKFVFLHKFIFVKYFSNTSVLKNIVGYIADDAKMRRLLFETLEKLFSVWSDSSAIKHVSYEQHKYITQAIFLCIGHMSEAQLKTHKYDLTGWLAPGMGRHLDSTNSNIRRLGMMVGECVALKTDLGGDNKLEFGYQKDKETESIMKLLEPDEPPTKDYYEKLLQHYNETKNSIKSKLKNTSQKDESPFESFTASKATFLKVFSNTKSETLKEKFDKSNYMERVAEGGSELDSDDDDDDDDLQPYDLSNNTVYRKVKPPTYIRDCMEGLLEQDNRAKIEVSLGAATDLIKKNPVAAKEISVELCKILLSMNDKYAIDNFTIYRMSAMTELAIINPEPVAGYLTHEFYEEEYCLQHRLDILDVLTAASRILSSVERGDSSKARKELAQDVTAPSHSSENWRSIVDRRIEAKTRRFGKVKKRSLPPKHNQFGTVAGFFFYPLLSGYDKRVRTMDLLGNDALVLGRLLYSVGTIVYSSINTMAASNMVKSLLEFVFEIRFHPESYVRQATLFCILMASITDGKVLLGLDILDEIILWIDQVIGNDLNEKTKQLASQTAMAVRTCLSKELHLNS